MHIYLYGCLYATLCSCVCSFPYAILLISITKLSKHNATPQFSFQVSFVVALQRLYNCTLCPRHSTPSTRWAHTKSLRHTHTHRHKHTQLNKISSTPLQSLWFHQANYFAILYTARSWRWQREKFTKGLKSFIVKSRLL